MQPGLPARRERAEADRQLGGLLPLLQSPSHGQDSQVPARRDHDAAEEVRRNPVPCIISIDGA